MNTLNLYEETILTKIRNFNISDLNKLMWIIDDFDLMKNNTSKEKKIENLAGKYKDCNTSSYDFIRRKQEEKELEL